MHPFASFDSSGREKMYPKKCTMALMYKILEMIDCAMRLKMFKEWKNTKRMDRDTIARDRFNAGYDKGYKERLKKDLQNISYQTPHNFCSVMDRKLKAVAGIQR